VNQVRVVGNGLVEVHLHVWSDGAECAGAPQIIRGGDGIESGQLAAQHHPLRCHSRADVAKSRESMAGEQRLYAGVGCRQGAIPPSLEAGEIGGADGASTESASRTLRFPPHLLGRKARTTRSHRRFAKPREGYPNSLQWLS